MFTSEELALQALSQLLLFTIDNSQFAAFIIDGFILAFVQIPLVLLVDDIAIAYVLSFLVGFIFIVGFWSTEGATPGMMAMGCKITTEDGDPISVGRAIGRYFAWILSYVILYIGLIMIAFTPQKRGLHDLICGTVVIKTR